MVLCYGHSGLVQRKPKHTAHGTPVYGNLARHNFPISTYQCKPVPKAYPLLFYERLKSFNGAVVAV